KVIYGWGLRRTETSKLDVVDFGRNAKARQFGRYGTLNVRYGKAKKGHPAAGASSTTGSASS
ncbi:site-specific integrase, partial [Streptomyces sp. BE133]|nr:site-specific integrase [Streptomyces sp. BE133]